MKKSIAWLILMGLWGYLCYAQSVTASNNPVSVCEVLENRIAYNDLRVVIEGRYANGVLRPSACSVDLFEKGRMLESCLYLTPGAFPENPAKKPRLPYRDEPGGPYEVVLTGKVHVSPEEKVDPASSSAHVCPASFSYDRIDKVKEVSLAALTVCDLLANKSKYHGTVVTVRGDFVRENGLAVLRPYECTIKGGIRPGFSSSVPLGDSHSITMPPAEQRSTVVNPDLVVIMTVTGRFVTGEIENSSRGRVQAKYEGGIIYYRERQIGLLKRGRTSQADETGRMGR